MCKHACVTYHTSSVLFPASLLGGLDHFPRNDGAVRSRNCRLLQFARNAFPDQMSQAQTDLGDFSGWAARLDLLVKMGGKHLSMVSFVLEIALQVPCRCFVGALQVQWRAARGVGGRVKDLRALSSS